MSTDIRENIYQTARVVREQRAIEREGNSYFQYRKAIEEVKVARRNLPLDRAFWSRVHQPDEGCWDWMGPRDRAGYGHLSHQGRAYAAHRLSLEWKIGRPLAPGMMALHTCGRAPCVRPEHLYEGTAAENQRDR